MAEKPKPKVKDVMVPGQGGATMIEEIARRLKQARESMNQGRSVVLRKKKK